MDNRIEEHLTVFQFKGVHMKIQMVIWLNLRRLLCAGVD